MDFVTAVRTCLQKYTVYQGRASRPEYWWFVLFSFGVNVMASLVDQIIGRGVFGLLASLALLLPGICVGIRRLHDTDRSGWWLLTGLGGSLVGGLFSMLFMPLGVLIMLGAFGYLIFLLAQPGTPGPNRFGMPG
jgi:uncharacterized membrane protein YhaH (DUF805 family)